VWLTASVKDGITENSSEKPDPIAFTVYCAELVPTQPIPAYYTVGVELTATFELNVTPCPD